MTSEQSSSLPTLISDSTTGSNNTSPYTTTEASPGSVKMRLQATTQYHAQLFSGQQQLQKRQLQLQQQQKRDQENHCLSGMMPAKPEHSFDQHHSDPLTFVPPNLYRTSLRLIAETNIHAWWACLVDILSQSSFHAARVFLSVPQDASDPWIGPWGLRAVWCKSSRGQHGNSKTESNDGADYFTSSQKINNCDGRIHYFERLQAFESEPEPLINNAGIQRVIRRNAIVVLSREYRQRSKQAVVARHLLKDHFHHQFPPDDSRDVFKRAIVDQREKSAPASLCHTTLVSTPCLHRLEESNGKELFGEAEILADSQHITDCLCETSERQEDSGLDSAMMYDYDEYEQQQPSPWSQSPAPSPAMMDPDTNPFFQSEPVIDDEAFNPASPESYQSSSIPFPLPPSNVHSVIHIPLTHGSGNSENATDGNSFETQYHPKNQTAPIAVLSFLSSVVPYPAALISSLFSLAPFIATSFLNASEHAQMEKHYAHCGYVKRRPCSRRPSYNRRSKSTTTEQAYGRSNAIGPTSDSDTTSPYAASPQDQQHHKPVSVSGLPSFTSNSSDTVTKEDQGGSDGSSITSSVEPPLSPVAEYPRLTTCAQSIVDSSAEVIQNDKRGKETYLQTGNIEVDLESRSRSSFCSSEAINLPSPMTILGESKPASRSINVVNAPSVRPAGSADLIANNATGRRLNRAAGNTRRRRRKYKVRRRIYHSGFGHVKVVSSSGEDDLNSVTGHIPGKSNLDRLFLTPKPSLLRLVIDGIPIHVFTCSPKTGKVTWVNNRILQYTGLPLHDHLGPGWLSHMHPDDQTDCRKAWEKAFEQGKGFAGEYRLRRFDGVYRFFLWRIVPLRDVRGRIVHWFGTCTDIHDQHIANESNLRQMEIESNERKYRLLAEAIPQIVFTFSPGTGVTYANEKWESYSGCEFEKTQGFGFMAQVHPEDRQKLQLPDLLPHETAGIIWQSEIRLLGRDEQYRWFLVKCISVDELDTGDVRWFGTCTDINDHKLLEYKLKEAHDAAQKSTESKTRFLSNMSHEIRTPLIGITGMLNFLLDTELTPEQLDYAHTIQQSAESLLVVINDILDLSKVEAGMMKLEWEPFSLLTMIEDANELLSTLAIQKGLELSYWVDEDVPDVVVGDRVRLRQVLLNLIGNAIKFTTEGEVYTQCTVQCIDTKEHEITLLFDVMDTGSGFDADGEAVMFKPFSQIDSSSTRKYGGSGLGLVISRQLIELHGGEMKCKSKKGKGSTFSFTAKFGIPPPFTRPRPQTPQNETTNNPFFRTSLCTMSHETSPANASPASTSSEFSTLVPSPLAHSKKHAQTADIPCSLELLQDALADKAASMRLVPPPSRTAKTQAPVKDSNKPDTSSKKVELAVPVITEGGTETKAAKTIAGGIRTPSSRTNLLSPNASVILPPRTPTRGSPLRVLLVSEWNHSRDTIAKHLRSILSSFSHYDYLLNIASDHIEAMQVLAQPEDTAYEYILINLSSTQHVLAITRLIRGRLQHQDTNVLIITTPMQRSMIMENAKDEEQKSIPQNCGFVFKPVKRSKLNWYFGIGQGGAGSDSGSGNNSSVIAAPDSSRQRVAIQKEVFRKMEADVGGKGFRVLLVEDNVVNQKVLTRYLTRVGLDVEVAGDGEACLELFYSHPPNYYSLILCDLFMPIKDGYETTREIREWEARNLGDNDKRIPIVALSANVMSDVAQKCLEGGFSTYISKPVNFATLSDIIRSHLLKSQHNTR